MKVRTGEGVESVGLGARGRFQMSDFRMRRGRTAWF